jgi:BirA family biotin operon repressor/biotin-[acetyl-CoA-carboxylase] ligase
VSRNSVWKAVKSLQTQGYSITAVTNRGYCLTQERSIFSAQSVLRELGADGAPFSIEVAEEVTSTNTLLKERAAAGAPEGSVLIAQRQTAGRGRQGRSFNSMLGTGLYLSVLLRPSMSATEASLLTTAAAVATAASIEEVSGRHAGIKWVNDIWIDGLKVCGILTEASIDFEGQGLEYVIVGIGVNLTEPKGGFQGDLAGVAGAVFGDKPVTPDAKSALAAGILRRFWAFYRTFGQRLFLEEYRRRSIVLGKEIMILGNPPQEAVALDIDNECRLRVRLPDGSERLLFSGEVSIRPKR